MNSYIRTIIDEVNSAFAENKPENFVKHCTDNVRWTVMGTPTLEGKEAIRMFMGTVPDVLPVITLNQVVVEGYNAVARGEMTMPDNNGVSIRYAYCDVYSFEGDKIAELITYMVVLKEE